MADYRPITDVMILARAKVKYYGAYPAGFLGRARHMLGVSPFDPVLHVCGGRIRDYPFSGLGRADKTVDLNPELQPDYVMDVRKELPAGPWGGLWAAILIDRPYTEEDAAHYVPGADKLPNLNDLVRRSLKLVPVGHRVGTLDYIWPSPGPEGKEIIVCAVTTGRNGRMRQYTVIERGQSGNAGSVRSVGLGRGAKAERVAAGLLQSLGETPGDGDGRGEAGEDPGLSAVRDEVGAVNEVDQLIDEV